MDLIVELPTSHKGYSAIATIVDRFTKLLTVVPVHTTITAPELADVIFENVVTRFSLPSEILSDRDSKFVSTFWQTLFTLSGTKLSMSSAHHPQTDGQTERANRTLEEMLRHYVCAASDDWCDLLSTLEFAYNSSVQASTGFTPFFMLLGYEPDTALSLLAKRMHHRGKPCRHQVHAGPRTPGQHGPPTCPSCPRAPSAQRQRTVARGHVPSR